MRKKFVLLFLGFLSMGAFAELQTLPAWAQKPQEGEYIGVSFPDNGEEQAISLALFSYVLGHTVEGYYNRNIMSVSDGINYRDNISTYFTYSGEIKYDIVRKEILPSGERIVCVREGNTNTDKVSISFVSESKHNKTSTIKSDTTEIRLQILVSTHCSCEFTMKNIGKKKTLDIKTVTDNARHYYSTTKSDVLMSQAVYEAVVSFFDSMVSYHGMGSTTTRPATPISEYQYLGENIIYIPWNMPEM